MAARASINQIVQIGVETTEGTAVAANRQLSTLGIDLNSVYETAPGAAAGYKVDTFNPVVRKQGEGTFQGPIDYNQIVYVLSGLVGSAAPVQIGATAGYTWTFTPTTSGADASRKSFTVEKGDADAAMKATGVVFTGLNLTLGNDGLNMNGDLICGYPTDGNTLTATPTAIAARPATRLEVDIYVDTTFGAIGSTKLASAIHAEFNLAGKYSPFYVINTAFGSYKETVERRHSISASFETEHNAASRALYADINSASARKKYIRFKAVGQNIGTAADETVQIDMVGEFSEATALGDNDGVFGYRYGFRLLHDATFGGAWKATVVNRLTGL